MRIKRSYLLAAAVISLIAALVLWPKTKFVETVMVELGPLTQTVVATGRVMPPARAELSAPVTATVKNVLVEAGDFVKAGQTLVNLVDETLESATAQAQASIKEAQARLEQLKQVGLPVAQQNAEQATANLKAAEAELQRTRELVNKKFVSQARLDEAQRAADTARAALSSAQTQVQANQVNGAETKLAQSRLDQAQAALQTAQARTKQLALNAPFEGQVLVRHVEPGAIAQPGKVLITLAQLGETQIYIDVDEKNLRFIKIGQKAKVTADAAPTQHFDTEVYFIAPAVDPARGTAEVRLHLAQPLWALKTDMTVSAEMVVGHKDQALQVESDAVRDADSAQPYILAIKNGKAQRLPVKLGLRGVGTTEILEGVQKGEVLIVNSANVQAGERVKSQPRELKKLQLELPAGLNN